MVLVTLGLLGTVVFSGAELPGKVSFSVVEASPPRVGYYVSVIDANRMWVGLTHTLNRGQSWTSRIPPDKLAHFLDSPLEYSVTRFFDDQRGVLSSSGAVWSTVDSGKTWKKILSGHLQGIEKAAGGTWWMAAGNDAEVSYYRSRDAGATWTGCGMDQKAVGGTMGSASFVDSMHGWTVYAKYNERGLPIKEGIAVTEDGGCHWRPIWWVPMESVHLLRQVLFVDPQVGWLLADGSLENILATHDGGLSWSPIEPPEEGFRPDGGGILLDRSRAWVAGSWPGSTEESSGLFYTDDGGSTWQGVSQRDLEEDLGLAKRIPVSWGYGYLAKVNAARERK